MNQFDAQIKAALAKLDTKDDSHWTQNGSPVIAVVSELAQIQGLKRADITAAAPTFTRENPTFEAPAETQAPAEGEAASGEQDEAEKEAAEENAAAAESTPSEEELAALEAAEASEEEDAAEDEDEGEPLDDGLSESEAALKAAEAFLAEEQEKAAEAQKKVAEAAAVRDAILEERAKHVHPHQNQIDIMQHLETQKQLRLQRAQRAQQVVYVPKAPIDQAMARKKGFGHARPRVPLKTAE